MPVRGRPRNPRGQRPARFAPRSQASTNNRSADIGDEQPTRFHQVPHTPVVRRGESPATSETESKVKSTAPGTIRRLWRQAVNFIPAPPPFAVSEQPSTITRALRYKTSSLYRQAGTDNTRWGARRPIVAKTNRGLAPTLQAGRKVNRPTVRNRLTSFGSRVPVLNRPGGS